MNMTSSDAVRLTDLVMLWLKETYPYWKFRWGESTKNALLDANGYTYAIVFDDSVHLMGTGPWQESIIKAADPEFFDLFSRHIIWMKQEWARGPWHIYGNT